MTYSEYRKKAQAEFDSLPIFFAFGKQQFKEEMEKRGLTENDVDKVYRLGSGFGGYYLKSDADIIRAYFEKEDELPKLMKNKKFAVSAFFSEMCNHEYGINYQGDWDVCSCFGRCEHDYGKSGEDYLKEIGYGDSVIDAYRIARNKYNKAAMENDWF